MRPIIALLTDFGLRDPYVAQVKAAILSRCRDAVIIDVTHEISAFNELQAAFILKVNAPHMPPGTIHVSVVDPGVGSGRRGIILTTKRGDVFIGPDTGFMVPAAEELGIRRAYAIEESRLPSRVSETFHARDVFAPVAGMVASGKEPGEIGREVSDFARLALPEPKISGSEVEVMVMHVDRFGNAITNLYSGNMPLRLGDEVKVEVGGREITCRLVRSYAYVGTGEPLLTIGGSGYLELSINRGSAAEDFGLKPGDKLKLIRLTMV
ncbi:MAG: S-adenosyl-l-methionine hydroxide adenosyltransferase family protein [Nitrososphaeria archaeon]|nr:S-adenosyl-l-methionine hydroxide adenosyltransferase family protein [Nitrososphaeria archaeon]